MITCCPTGASAVSAAAAAPTATSTPPPSGIGTSCRRPSAPRRPARPGRRRVRARAAGTESRRLRPGNRGGVFGPGLGVERDPVGRRRLVQRVELLLAPFLARSRRRRSAGRQDVPSVVTPALERFTVGRARDLPVPASERRSERRCRTRRSRRSRPRWSRTRRAGVAWPWEGTIDADTYGYDLAGAVLALGVCRAVLALPASIASRSSATNRAARRSRWILRPCIRATTPITLRRL